MISMIEITKFSKSDHGTVEVHNVITGNVTTTWFQGIDKNGNETFSGHVKDISIIGLRGWGTGLETRPTAKGERQDLQGVDKYDDMLIVITADGRIGVFDTVNFESTNAKGWYKDLNGNKNYLTGKYNNMKDGSYVINYGYHKNYAALWVQNNGKVPGFDPNGNLINMYGIHIHRGGLDWSWSKGCITIYDPTGKGAWADFMSYFQPNPIMHTTIKQDGKDVIVPMYDPFGNILGSRTGQRAGDLIITSF